MVVRRSRYDPHSEEYSWERPDDKDISPGLRYGTTAGPVENDGPIPPKPPLLRKTATPTRSRRRHCFRPRREGHQPFGSVCFSARDCFCAELRRRADETTVS
ncbi:uncharacterized protein LOC142776211 [Rhipicephalus microplus]|uniref:uncharacterized protein LOC142776211 n=1 Tax=Rhipicephalus microplus TaxID=6941 RepID=UPI003F6BF1A5